MKVFFNGFKAINAKNFFPTRTLLNNFEIESVSEEKDADLIFEAITRERTFARSSKKVIFIAADNVLFKKNIFSIVESLFFRLGFRKNKYKIMDFLDKIIPKNISSLPLFSFFPKQEKVLKEVCEEDKKNKYFILPNKSNNKNVLSMPYFIQVYFDKLSLLVKKKKTGGRNKFCAFAVSSNSSRERVKFLKKLSKYKRVDSYGNVMNNMGEDKLKDWVKNKDLFEDYKFVICFENSFDDDYITEKLVNVMMSGAIPIYHGAPNIGEYFNTKSFINYEDFGSYEKMIEKVIELDQYDEKYKKVLNEPWFKNNKVPLNIRNKEEELIKFYMRILNEKAK